MPTTQAERPTVVLFTESDTVALDTAATVLSCNYGDNGVLAAAMSDLARRVRALINATNAKRTTRRAR